MGEPATTLDIHEEDDIDVLLGILDDRYAEIEHEYDLVAANPQVTEEDLGKPIDSLDVVREGSLIMDLMSQLKQGGA